MAGLAPCSNVSVAALDDCSEILLVTGDQVDEQLIEAVSALGAGDGGDKVVVLCDQAGVRDVRSLIAAGASGVVLREEESTTLGPTIEAVRAGQICFPSRSADALERPVLSIREKQAVGLVAMGLTNREIADRLFIAESTVKSHLSSAFAKLGVRSRHEAIDLIVNPALGMGMGILYLEAEPVQGAGR
jgi:DNA-binding NarL/FixJ family response regulator